jgi:uncharacterized protein with PQ loop repeat
MYNETVGYVGGTFYALCYLPQLYDIWHDKNSELSYNFMFLQFLAASFMFLYGLTNELRPIWLLNGWSWLCIVAIVAGMIKNKRRREQPQPPRPPFVIENLGIDSNMLDIRTAY